MEDHPELVGPLREDYHYLAKLIPDELGPEAPQNTRSEVLIEGYRPEELFAALGPELEAEVLSGRPLVAQVGTAEILMAFRVEDGVLIAEVAHVDGGGEGVLPVLIISSSISPGVITLTASNGTSLRQPVLGQTGACNRYSNARASSFVNCRASEGATFARMGFRHELHCHRRPTSALQLTSAVVPAG